MAVLALTAVGGLLGGAIGGSLAISIGMMAGSMLGQTLFGPTIEGPRLSDLKVSASTYGNAIPEVYGSVRCATNMIWSSGIKETKKKSGGKGGPKQVTYSYDASFAMAMCKGPIDGVLRIWADGKLIYDESANATRFSTTTGHKFYDILSTARQNVLLGKNKTKDKYKIRVYRGDEEQLPDSIIEADKGVGRVSAYRGLAYLVFEKFQLEDFANRIPSITVEVVKEITGNYPSLLAKTSSGSTYPNTVDKRVYPDWSTNKLYMCDYKYAPPYYTTVFDMTTMQELYSYPGQFQVGGNAAAWIPGTGINMTQGGASNSRPLIFNDMSTGQQVGSYGNETNNVGMIHLNGDGTLRAAYSAHGQACANFHVSSGGVKSVFIVRTSWTRDTIAFRPGQEIPIFITSAPYEPFEMFAGKSGSVSDVVGWRNGGGGLQLTVWSIGAGASGSYYFDPIRRYQNGGFGMQDLTLQPFAGEGYEARLALYDPTDDTVFSLGWSNGVPCSFKYSLSGEGYKFKVKYPGLRVPSRSMRYSQLAGGTFGWIEYVYPQAGFWINQISLQNGELLKAVNVFSSNLGDWHLLGDDQYWDDYSNSVVLNTGNGYRRVFLLSGGAGFSIRSVVADVCRKTGVLTDDDLDVSGLTDDTLVGYQIDRACTARDVLKQLGTAYLFDGYESDYKLKFRSRGNASSVTITEDWIGRNREDHVISETLTQELEMPLRINVTFYDVTRDHQQGSQSAKRNSGPIPTMWTNKEDAIELPITWTPTQAVQCADKLLKMAWANRWTYGLSLPWRFLKYDPSDVITVQLLKGTQYTIRLTDFNIGADFTIETKGVSEKATAYVSAVTGSTSEAPVQYIPGAFPAKPVILNTPLLRDEDYTTTGNAITYISVAPMAPIFNGATIYMSEDLIEYDSIGTVGAGISTGICLSTLPATTAYESTDETTVLRVRLTDPDADLESVTQEVMLTSYVNAAAVGDEIIQFRDAVQQANGEWWLTGILRARRGTNYAIKGHTPAETFTLLTEQAVMKWTRTKENYTASRLFRSVPDGTIMEDAEVVAADLVPRDLMPYTPEHFTITDDDTDVEITMQRRSRVIDPLEPYTGFIHYKEGETVTAKIKYEIWPGLTIDDVDTAEVPPITGSIPLFDSSGVDIPATLTFPLASLDSETTFLLKAYEVGIVDGIPKWIAYERIDTDRWNATDAY